jgi:hypothetical protein
VDGTNYLFICTGKPVVANPVAGLYVIKVFVKLPCIEEPNIELKGIVELDIAALAKYLSIKTIIEDRRNYNNNDVGDGFCEN